MLAWVIETPSLPWQGSVLPLNHARNAQNHSRNDNNTKAVTCAIVETHAPVVKRISRDASDVVLWVQILPGAHIKDKNVDKSVDMCIKDNRERECVREDALINKDVT